MIVTAAGGMILAAVDDHGHGTARRTWSLQPSTVRPPPVGCERQDYHGVRRPEPLPLPPWLRTPG